MKTKLDWLEVALLTAPLVALAIYWNDLPGRVPIHWDLRGQINGWATKTLVREADKVLKRKAAAKQKKVEE